MGLEYLHSNGIIHRDIKPENLICDDKGYFHITDLGIAKRINNHILVTSEITGTPGYIAPEAVLTQRCSYECDFFSLGVILHELVLYNRPYVATNKIEMKEEFKKKVINVQPQDIPQGFHTKEICDFINRLLIVNPEKRLGTNGTHEIKEHPWFNGFNWDNLKNQKIISSFIPKIGEFRVRRNLSKTNSHGNYTEKEINKIINSEQFQKNFENYNFFDAKKKYDNKNSIINGSFFKERFNLKKKFTTTKNLFLQGNIENTQFHGKLNQILTPITIVTRRHTSKKLSFYPSSPKNNVSNIKLIGLTKSTLNQSNSGLIKFSSGNLSPTYPRNFTYGDNNNSPRNNQELPAITPFSPYRSPREKLTLSPEITKNNNNNQMISKKMSLCLSHKNIRKKVSLLMNKKKLFL